MYCSAAAAWLSPGTIQWEGLVRSRAVSRQHLAAVSAIGQEWILLLWEDCGACTVTGVPVQVITIGSVAIPVDFLRYVDTVIIDIDTEYRLRLDRNILKGRSISPDISADDWFETVVSPHPCQWVVVVDRHWPNHRFITTRLVKVVGTGLSPILCRSYSLPNNFATCKILHGKGKSPF